MALASGVPVEAHRAVSEIEATDIIIVPSVLLGAEGWKTGRYPELVEWAARMHARGALLCSACSGVFLLAETGLFDGRETTVHWGYADEFAQDLPARAAAAGARAGRLRRARGARSRPAPR